MVSVIVPVYNGEKTLRKCVESLAYGEAADVEILLVEDCSRDGSWALCQTLARELPGVKCLRNAVNSGVSFTRNRGLSLAGGEYVCFVDCDDWVSGDYVSRLADAARENPEYLTLCGFRFHQQVAGYSADYLWRGGERVPREALFDLWEATLLQSPCNKLFRRDIITAGHLRFDEKQTMGEDFQFLLDYLEAGDVRGCAVVNEPLYHYIRWGEDSLMSKFGQIERENEFARLEQLLRLCGADARQRYTAAVEKLKKNYVYHALRNPRWSGAQKSDYIREVMGDAAPACLREQRQLMARETLAAALSWGKRFPGRAWGYLQRKWLAIFVRRQRKKLLPGESFTLLSQNCVGGVVYHDLGLRFDSPTIDLYLTGADFLRFVENFGYYASLEPVMRWGACYPIGCLGDIQVHFMHYDTCTQAREAWQRRKERLHPQRLAVLCTDSEGFSQEELRRWRQLPYPKLLFTADAALAGEPDAVFFPEFSSRGQVGDLISQRKFYRHGRLMAMLNSIRREEAK